jgi:methionine synthase II (cobalamin-independent)
VSRHPWPAGTATGIGSLPGVDAREATRVVLGELPDLPHLAELPARGAGADMVGRTLALMPGFAAETVPTGWRVADHDGSDQRRARSWLAEDLDALEELGAGAPVVKVSLAGPLTVAASLELASGERLLRDHGAVRDVVASLAEAVAAHVAEVRRRLSGTRIVVQLDEPSLPAALAAAVPTASGFATLRRVDPALARTWIATVLEAVVAADAVPAVHSCAPDVPIALLCEAGAQAVSIDATLLGLGSGRLDDVLGECVEAGVSVWLGVVPTGGAGMSGVVGTVSPVRGWWKRLGMDPAALGEAVVLTPACGLASASPTEARAALALARDAGRVLVEEPEEVR